jgi:hypothetical protein
MYSKYINSLNVYNKVVLFYFVKILLYYFAQITIFLLEETSKSLTFNPHVHMEVGSGGGGGEN